jgi:putative hydrolase of HD superfamily
MLPLLSAISDLKSLPRTGWLLAGVTLPESVADHTCGVALLALALAGEINADPAAQGLDAPLDAGRATAIALVHDLAEYAVTDLPRRATALIGAQAKHAAERRALEELLAGQAGGGALLACWEEYDAGATPEALLVRDADKLDMLHQALRYRRRGHTNLGEFVQGHAWRYPLCAAIAADLSNLCGAPA